MSFRAVEFFQVIGLVIFCYLGGFIVFIKEPELRGPTSFGIKKTSNDSAFPPQQPNGTHQKQQSRTDSLKVTAVPEDIGALPPNFRLSGRVFPSLHLGDKPVQVENLACRSRYQCADKAYEEFMDTAFRFVLNKVRNESLSIEEEGWGRRPSIVPPSIPTTGKRNRNILMFGNSHAYQTAAALEMQYANNIQSFQSFVLHKVETFSFFNPAAAGNFTVTITGLFNHPCLYSARWKENLEQAVLNSSLSVFDAIVMGRFNPYSKKFRSSKQWTWNEMYRQAHPEQQVDMEQNPNPFSLRDLANVFSGPIVSISTFSLGDQKYHDGNIKTVQQLAAGGRTNLCHINARQYISLIARGECSSDNNTAISTAGNRTGSHRCVGAKGGLPDFVAWDLVEALHDIFSEP